MGTVESCRGRQWSRLTVELGAIRRVGEGVIGGPDMPRGRFPDRAESRMDWPRTKRANMDTRHGGHGGPTCALAFCLAEAFLSLGHHGLLPDQGVSQTSLGLT